MRRLERLHKEGARRDRNAEAAQPLSGRGSRALDQPLPSALTDAFSDTRRGVNTVDHSYTSIRSPFKCCHWSVASLEGVPYKQQPHLQHHLNSDP